MSEPNYRRKHPEVFARKAENAMTVLHHVKGEQHAKKGDWLVGTERGQIEVFKPSAFEAEFEAIPEGPSDLEKLQAAYDDLQRKLA